MNNDIMQLQRAELKGSLHEMKSYAEVKVRWFQIEFAFGCDKDIFK